MPQRRTSARFEARRPRRLRLRRGSRPTAAAAVAAAAAAALADTRALQFLVGAQHQVIGARGLGRCAAVRMRLPNGWCGRPTPQPARTSGASGVRRSSARGARSWSRQFLEAEAAVTDHPAAGATPVLHHLISASLPFVFCQTQEAPSSHRSGHRTLRPFSGCGNCTLAAQAAAFWAARV